jgi:hypothetical protein
VIALSVSPICFPRSNVRASKRTMGITGT